MLPRFQERYNGMTGIVIETIRCASSKDLQNGHQQDVGIAKVLLGCSPDLIPVLCPFCCGLRCVVCSVESGGCGPSVLSFVCVCNCHCTRARIDALDLPFLIYLQKFACTHACMHAHTHKHISENKCLQTTTERANGNMAGLSGPRTAARPRSEASAPACQGLRVSGLEAGDHLCI